MRAPWRSFFYPRELGLTILTTNWAVVTTGIALSATYSSAEASPLPMVLVGLLVSVFLLFEARRYRYFNVWRARARLLSPGSLLHECDASD
jgi:uncharacterized membrane protein